uniref:Uncharacterized protein n=1 Tax=Oryza brachyantha TaxID=4533 RepID=J3N8A2_ORYBR
MHVRSSSACFPQSKQLLESLNLKNRFNYPKAKAVNWCIRNTLRNSVSLIFVTDAVILIIFFRSCTCYWTSTKTVANDASNVYATYYSDPF